MGQLVKYELRKIVCRKMVYFMLLFLVFFNWLGYGSTGVSAERVVTTEGDILTGTEAVRYMQEFDRRYAGELTEEKVKQLDAGVYAREAAEKAEGEIGVWQYPDLIQYVDYRFYGYDDFRSGETAIPEMGEIRLGYHRGYSMFQFFVMNMMLVAGCVIVIAVSPVFAEEYGRGTDALVLTARYGKTKLITAKTTAAFLFSFLLCLGTVAVNGIALLLNYGTEGMDTSVQVDFMGRNWGIPYEMNYGQLLGYAVLTWLMACFLLTGITLMISACCNTSYAAVIFAAACYVMPVWFSLPDWVKTMMPAYQMQVEMILEFGYFHVLGQKIMPLWIVTGISAAAMVFFSICAKKKFAGRQVR